MKKLARIIALLMAVMLIAVNFAACGSQKLTPKEAGKGVVKVMQHWKVDVYYANFDNSLWELVESYNTWAVGSAWGVGEVGKETDIFITNSHVTEKAFESYTTVANGNGIMFDYIFLGYYILLDDFAYDNSSHTLDTSRAVPCKVLYEVDPSEKPDIAVLQAAEPVKGRIALAFAEDDKHVDKGDMVYSIGYPAVADVQGDAYFKASVDSQTVRSGAVSQHTTMRDARGNARVVQHDARIDGGNSGGPLINGDGLVVGINTWSVLGDEGDNALFYSVETDYLCDILDGLHIEYNVYSGGIPSFVLWIIIAVVVIAIIVIIVVVLLNRPKPSDDQKVDVHVQDGGQRQELAPGDTGYRVQGVSGVHQGRRYAMMAGKPMIFGRGAGSVIRYPDGTPGVSGTHCTIWSEGGRLFIKDNGSSHGTFVNQNKLAANQTVQLSVGDNVALGSQKEQFIIASKGGV